MCLISKPPSPNIVSPSSSLLFSILSFFFLLVCFTSSCRWAPWPPARTVWTIVIVFSHYFFFFIVNLFKCPHCHLPPSCYAFFFFWPIPTRPRHMTQWRPRPARPWAQWHQGSCLFLGGVSSLLLCQGVANALWVFQSHSFLLAG